MGGGGTWRAAQTQGAGAPAASARAFSSGEASLFLGESYQHLSRSQVNLMFIHAIATEHCSCTVSHSFETKAV